MTELLCPKCQAPMRTYERSGVHVDRCTECRGVFLDAGELERVMQAEAVFDQRERWARQDSGGPSRGDYEPERRDRRRRGGFLGDLFGGDDD